MTVRIIHMGDTSLIPGPVALAKGFVFTVDGYCMSIFDLLSVQHAEHSKYDELCRFSSIIGGWTGRWHCGSAHSDGLFRTLFQP